MDLRGKKSGGLKRGELDIGRDTVNELFDSYEQEYF